MSKVFRTDFAKYWSTIHSSPYYTVDVSQRQFRGNADVHSCVPSTCRKWHPRALNVHDLCLKKRGATKEFIFRYSRKTVLVDF